MRTTLAAIVFFLSACSANSTALKPPPLPPTPTEAVNAAAETYKAFLTYMRENYYQNIDLAEVTRWAMSDVITRLNPHGYIVPNVEHENCPFETGLGVELLRNRSGRVMVSRAAHPGAAFDAGVEIGDEVIEVNGTPIIAQTHDEVAALIVCNDKPSVHLRLLRGNEVFEKTIVKHRHKFRDFLSKTISDNIEYLWLSDVGESAWSLYAKMAFDNLARRPSRRLILDMRSMRGGFINSAVGLVSAFVPNDTTLFMVGDATPIKSASSRRTLANQVVVLTNRATISVGEIIALAFKNTGRATIIGERTAGFGTFLSIYELPDRSFFRIPTREYYGLWGDVVERNGVVPDIEVKETNPTGHYVPEVYDAILERALLYLRESHMQYAKAPE